MKPAALFLRCGVLLAALGTAQPGQAQPDKLPVFLQVTAADSLGYQVSTELQALLRRSPAMVVVADGEQAWFRFGYGSLKMNDTTTVFTVTASLNDQGAYTGKAYWSGYVGYCRTGSAMACAKDVMAYLDQVAEEFKAEDARRRAATPPPAATAGQKKR